MVSEKVPSGIALARSAVAGRHVELRELNAALVELHVRSKENATSSAVISCLEAQHEPG